MMEDPYDLNRFIQAQYLDYDIALNEIKNGKKTSHWMWYVFPQIQGLVESPSSTTIKYAISNANEAELYLKHPILGQRLIEITRVFLNLNQKSAYAILGYPDDLKMKSCMTLFNAIQSHTDVFGLVLEKYYPNDFCKETLSKVKNS